MAVSALATLVASNRVVNSPPTGPPWSATSGRGVAGSETIYSPSVDSGGAVAFTSGGPDVNRGGGVDIPIRHHFLPVFHLSEWAVDGFVKRWGRIPYNEKLVQRDVSPRSTAYRDHLYSYTDYPGKAQAEIETEVLSPIDNAAAPILKKLLVGGGGKLSDEERVAWARYMLTARYRVPSVLNAIKADAYDTLHDETQHIRQMFEQNQQYMAEESYEEFLRARVGDPKQNLGLLALKNLVNDERTINRLAGFRWFVRRLSPAGLPAVLGDRPLMVVSPFYNPEPTFAIPLSPHAILFASSADWVINKIRNSTARNIAELSNGKLISEAAEHVYGDCDEAFMQEHLPRSIGEVVSLVPHRPNMP